MTDPARRQDPIGNPASLRNTGLARAGSAGSSSALTGRFGTHLLLDCSAYRLNRTLNPHDGVACQLFGGDRVEALDERTAPGDELVTQNSQLLDLGHDYSSESLVRSDYVRTLREGPALQLTHHFATGNAVWDPIPSGTFGNVGVISQRRARGCSTPHRVNEAQRLGYSRLRLLLFREINSCTCRGTPCSIGAVTCRPFAVGKCNMYQRLIVLLTLSS